MVKKPGSSHGSYSKAPCGGLGVQGGRGAHLGAAGGPGGTKGALSSDRGRCSPGLTVEIACCTVSILKARAADSESLCPGHAPGTLVSPLEGQEDSPGACGGAEALCTARPRLCSAVALLLAQRNRAESPGSAASISREERDSLSILAEKRSWGSPDLSRGSLLLKEARN